MKPGVWIVQVNEHDKLATFQVFVGESIETGQPVSAAMNYHQDGRYRCGCLRAAFAAHSGNHRNLGYLVVTIDETGKLTNKHRPTDGHGVSRDIERGNRP